MKQSSILLSVFQRMQPRLFAAARRIVHSDEDAHDVLQEAFFRLWRRHDTIGDPVAAEGLSVTAVRSAAIDAERRRAARGVTVDIDTTLELPLQPSAQAENDLFGEIKGIIDSTLTPRQREVLYMRDYQGMEMEDISVRMDTSEANVRVLLSRARNTVREIYKNRQNEH